MAKDKIEKVIEPKLGFLTWFVVALDVNKSLQPHHMTSLKAYFADLGLKEEQTASEYYAALKKYGL